MRITVKLFIILILVFCPLFVFGNADFPSYPMAFWGSAKLNNSSLPLGTKIMAYCGNNSIGEVTMLENGIYGYEDAIKIRLLVSNCTGDILFKYLLSGETEPKTGANEIKYTDGFEEGKTVRKDLSFTFAAPALVPAAGGGGGGGGEISSSSQTSNETSTNKGDATGDGKVNILDFNILMINWGKTGISNVVDFNSDGKVDIIDFNILMINWTK